MARYRLPPDTSSGRRASRGRQRRHPGIEMRAHLKASNVRCQLLRTALAGTWAVAVDFDRSGGSGRAGFRLCGGAYCGPPVVGGRTESPGFDERELRCWRSLNVGGPAARSATVSPRLAAIRWHPGHVALVAVRPVSSPFFVGRRHLSPDSGRWPNAFVRGYVAESPRRSPSATAAGTRHPGIPAPGGELSRGGPRHPVAPTVDGAALTATHSWTPEAAAVPPLA